MPLAPWRVRQVRVTLIDRQNHHVFQPLLYQVATAGLSPGDIASPIRWILRRQENLRVLLATVERIDPDAKRLHLDGGDSVAYDSLIVGARASRTRTSGTTTGRRGRPDSRRSTMRWRFAGACCWRSSGPSANPIRDRQRPLLTFVIVGGGPTGVELAGALAEIARHALKSEFDNVDPASARILLVEAGPSILHDLPRVAADLRAEIAGAAGRAGGRGARRHRDRAGRGAGRGRADRRRRPCCGRRACRRRRWAAASAPNWIARAGSP